jgi:hypothetical protein
MTEETRISNGGCSMKKKHILCAALIMGMLVSSLLAACGAPNDGEASDYVLRAELVEGSASRTNRNGKTFELLSDTALFGGDLIGTEPVSYAYISFDGSKAGKLDESSLAEIAESGRKLEVNVMSGSFFFNVSKLLANDEEMFLRIYKPTEHTTVGAKFPARQNHTPNRISQPPPGIFSSAQRPFFQFKSPDYTQRFSVYIKDHCPLRRV